MHTGTQSSIFGNMLCGLMKPKLNFLSVSVWGYAFIIPPVKYGGGSIMLWGRGTLQKTDDVTRKTTWCGNTEATTHTIKEVKAWVFVTESLVTERPSQSLDLSLTENLWPELKRHVWAKATYKPDWVTPVLSGGMRHNSGKLFWETCGRELKTLDPIQFTEKTHLNMWHQGKYLS